jgi:site-specific DNA recombinase
MTGTAINQAKWGDLKGLHLAGMVRLSFELENDADPGVDPDQKPEMPRMGSDIKGRALQEGDCEGYVTRRGGIYVHTYQEPDTSAWKRRRVVLPDGTVAWRVSRPVFEGALEDLKRGVAPNGKPLDGLVVYDLDRLTRDNRHLEDAIDVVMHYDRPILDTTGSIDLLTENGRSMARVLVAMSSKQSADTARRVQRKHQAMQQEGIPAGGRRPFGWEKDKRTLKPEEANELREGALKVLGGAPIASVVVDWNARGVTTASGRRWEITSLKAVLRNPRICGYRARIVRTYNQKTESESQAMEIVRDVDGNPVIGQWEPILTVQEWETLTALIGARGVSERGKNSRIYLLTGILRCGRDGCNKKLRAYKAQQRDNKTDGYFYYGCPSKSAGGCGGVSISGPPTDRLVEALVINKFEEEAAKRSGESQEEQAWDGEQRLAEVSQSIRDMTASWRSPGGMSPARYFALLPEVEAEERELKAAREAWLARMHAVNTRPTNIRAEWNDYLLPEKRAHIEEALVTVLINPADPATHRQPKRTHPIEKYAARLEPIWRDAEPDPVIAQTDATGSRWR